MNSLGQVSHNEIEPGVLKTWLLIAFDAAFYAIMTDDYSLLMVF